VQARDGGSHSPYQDQRASSNWGDGNPKIELSIAALSKQLSRRLIAAGDAVPLANGPVVFTCVGVADPSDEAARQKGTASGAPCRARGSVRRPSSRGQCPPVRRSGRSSSETSRPGFQATRGRESSLSAKIRPTPGRGSSRCCHLRQRHPLHPETVLGRVVVRPGTKHVRPDVVNLEREVLDRATRFGFRWRSACP